jgi:hypothetical protein
MGFPADEQAVCDFYEAIVTPSGANFNAGGRSCQAACGQTNIPCGQAKFNTLGVLERG